MTEFAIRVENLGKRYHLTARQQRNLNLREAVMARLSSFTGALRPHPEASAPKPGMFWALRDVSLQVKHGESVALIGPNGSGKSTLLKILSRIVAPSSGRAEIYGRVSALLEVGTGFHPDLSGRDNIFLNGSILGMTSKEIKKRFDSIVDFAGVEPFLDTPIKRFSSGMALRLGFAVAAHLEPDVLIVDEVLAVGDAEFQRKCLVRMDEVSRSGCTVLFVSHNLHAVQQLCARAVLLESGRISAQGRTSAVISDYLSRTIPKAPPNAWFSLPRTSGPQGTGGAFTAVRFGRNGQEGVPRSAQRLLVGVKIHSDQPLKGAEIAVSILDLLGTKLIDANSRLNGDVLLVPAGESLWWLNIQTLQLKPGRYLVSLYLGDPTRMLDLRTAVISMEVAHEEAASSLAGYADPIETGVVPCSFSFEPDGN